LCGWGSNASGALGDGTTTDRPTPVPLSLSNVTAVSGSAYGYFGAAFTLYLKSDGTVDATGWNGEGELGNGSTSSSAVLSPTPVSGLSGIKSIVAGPQDGYALANDGTVWSWGENVSGQLGNGQLGGSSNLPTHIAGLSNIVAIAASAADGWALDASGVIWGWGANISQVLTQQPGVNWTGTPTPIVGVTDVRQIVGIDQTLYALRTDGTVWAWGNNAWGQLGNPTSTLPNGSATPVQVNGLTNISALAGNSSAQTAYALQSDGTVKSWGYGGTGELGDGQPVNPNGGTYSSSQPVSVQGLTGITAIAGGASNGFARAANGSLWSWGDTFGGALGNGLDTGFLGAQTTPVQVSGATGSAIFAGYDDGFTVSTPAPTVTLAQGPAAPQGYRYAITLSGFAPNSTVSVNCYNSVSPNSFYAFTMTTDANGSAFTQSYCYSGDGPDHWVIANGVQSNHVTWSSGSTGEGGGGSTSPPPSGPASVFYSPNSYPNGIASVPTIADLNLVLDEWTSPNCGIGNAANIPSSVNQLAGWSKGRLGPIYALYAQQTSVANLPNIHLLTLFDPGNKADFTGRNNCDTRYNINQILSTWLQADSRNYLVVLTGLNSEDRSKPAWCHQNWCRGPATFSGLWHYYFAGIWNQPFANRALVCDYAYLSHDDVLRKFSWIVQNPLVTVCPTAAGAPRPTPWHP
jgi:alpha-tubulin suppressor-like RCC1 family protein